MSFCTKCGSELQVSYSYCGSCGAKVLYTENEKTLDKKFKKITDINILDSSTDLSRRGDMVKSCVEQVNNKSKNIFLCKNITENIIAYHKLKYLELEINEVPLLVLNAKGMIGNVFTGLCITNTNIHYKTIKDSFFTGLIPSKDGCGKKRIYGLNSLEIAEHDTAFGTAYIGHQLKIDDCVVGLVRMGRGILYDEDALMCLNNLFNIFSEHGLIKNNVKNYLWQ